MNVEWLKPELTLQNKCRGRYKWKSFKEMIEWCETKCPVQCRYDKRYPFEKFYIVHSIGRLTDPQFRNFRTSTIAFTMIPEYDSNGDEVHNYFTAYGYWLKKEKFLKDNSKFIDLERVEETCMASTIICEALAEAKLINEIGY